MTILCSLCHDRDALVGCGACGGYSCASCLMFARPDRCPFCALLWEETVAWNAN